MGWVNNSLSVGNSSLRFKKLDKISELVNLNWVC
jgi:hypothetical protein